MNASSDVFARIGRYSNGAVLADAAERIHGPTRSGMSATATSSVGVAANASSYAGPSPSSDGQTLAAARTRSSRSAPAPDYPFANRSRAFTSYTTPPGLTAWLSGASDSSSRRTCRPVA